MSIELEVYEQIRRYKEEGLGKKTVAKLLGVSRNTVKKYWDGSTVPWVRKEGSGLVSTVVTPEVKSFIIQCVEEDKEAPRKQRHTARRIYDRLVSEKGFKGAESTIRNVVAEIKKSNPKAFIPLEFMPGEAIQVDWGEATIFLNDVKIKVNIWCMRECYSCAIYVEAFYRQNEESFLEGMKNGFEYFGGTPKKVIFDNARVAVAEGFGKTAKTTEAYRKMSAHYVFKPTFCNVAEGHEKGLVENLVGLSRRNTLAPVPHVNSIEELNAMLKTYCDNYHNHKVSSKPDNVGVMLIESRKSFTKLPPYPFDTSATQSVNVNGFAIARYDGNGYSVPFQYAGKDITAKGYGRRIKFLYRNETIAEYERDYHKNHTHYQLDHYLELIERRPRSVYNAAPVKSSVPSEMYDYLLKTEEPEKVIRILKAYLRNSDAVMYGIRKGFNIQQLISHIEKIEEAAEYQPNITMSVNKTDLAPYDELIRSCM